MLYKQNRLGLGSNQVYPGLHLNKCCFVLSQETMDCHRSSGQNVSDFYQEAATCSEVSTYNRIQKRIGEAILSKFVSVNIESGQFNC